MVGPRISSPSWSDALLGKDVRLFQGLWLVSYHQFAALIGWASLCWQNCCWLHHDPFHSDQDKIRVTKLSLQLHSLRTATNSPNRGTSGFDTGTRSHSGPGCPFLGPLFDVLWTFEEYHTRWCAADTRKQCSFCVWDDGRGFGIIGHATRGCH